MIMNNTLKTLAVSLAAAIALSVVSAAHAAPLYKISSIEGFADMTNVHWAFSNTLWGKARGIVGGYPDGTFRPDASVTEAEFLSMLIRFCDVGNMVQAAEGESWSQPYYKAAQENDYPVTGEPAHPITRIEVAELLVSTQGYAYTKNEAIQFLLGKGIANGKTAATIAGFHGEDILTRGEAVTFIKNYADKSEIISLLPRNYHYSDPKLLPPLPEQKSVAIEQTESALETLRKTVEGAVTVYGHTVVDVKADAFGVIVKDSMNKSLMVYTDARREVRSDGLEGAEIFTLYRLNPAAGGQLDKDRLEEVVKVMQTLGISADDQIADAITTVRTTSLDETTVNYPDAHIWVGRGQTGIIVLVRR
jgi:hypothetical protein